MLLHPNSALRLGGITILSNSLMSDLKSNFINEYFKIPTLAKLMIGDKDEEVRESSLMLMLQLLNKNDWGLQQDIEKAISKEVDAGLNNTLKLYVLRSLSNINKVNHELLITIITKASATQLTNMIFLASDAEIHDKSQYIIRCLLTDGIFHNEVTETMIEYLDNMFKYSSPGTHFQIVDLTLKLLKDFSSYSTNFLKDNINSWIETIIIKHAFSFEDVYNASKTTICARNWLSHFTGKDDREMPNDSFQILYNKNVTDLKNIFTGGNSEIEFNKWKNAVSTALRERLSKELASDMWTRHALSAQFCQDMSWVPELIQLVTKNEGENVENEASESLKWIFKNANCDDIANAIKSSKSSFLKLINAVFSNELSFETQSVLIEIVDLILKRIDFTDGVHNMINGTISCQYHETRSMALAMLKSLVYTKSGSIPDELITPPEDFQLSLQELPAKWEAGIHWLELLTSLKQHIAKAEKIALNIISPLIANIRFITNRKSPVENHSSMPVHEQQDIGETLPAGSSNELCTYWVQAIGVLAVYYPEEMKNSLPILSDMAYNNESEEVRVATLKALTMITRTGKFKKEVQEFVSKRTQSSSDTEVFFFINIWESLILEGEFNLPLESLLKAAVTGNKYERWVYLKALKSLNILAKQEEEKLQESLKSTVSSIVEMPPSDLDWDIRRKWVKLYAMLAQKKHQYAVSIISKIAREDDDIDVQLEAIASLTSLLLKKDDKIRETLMKAVPLKFLDSVLNKQNHQAQCQAWAKLTSLLPPSSEQSFIPNLVKTSVSHTSENVKLIILELLITRDASESAILDLLSKQITQALKNPEDEVRMWAISTMELITAIGIAHGTNTIKPILSSVMPNVLKIIMNEVKSNIQSDAERIFQTMCANFGAKDITILRSSVSGIAEYLESITDKGRHFITLFVRTLAIGYRLDATVLKAVRDVASVLKNNSHSRLVRTTVLELLGYFNMREPCFTVIDSIIPDIIFIVLHDTDDNIRLLALNLIIQVANRDESGELCLSDIRRHHQLLMSLLEIDDLMHAAAEILSLLRRKKVFERIFY
ncbi:armadillo-type protein [Cyathus striatus]|nr:armadillo-type protein [Cyathus striatus]